MVEVTQKIFTTVRKEHKHGSKFSSSDWAVACRNCNWIDGKTFTQGDAEMIFQQQCKKDRKPNKYRQQLEETQLGPRNTSSSDSCALVTL